MPRNGSRKVKSGGSFGVAAGVLAVVAIGAIVYFALRGRGMEPAQSDKASTSRETATPAAAVDDDAALLTVTAAAPEGDPPSEAPSAPVKDDRPQEVREFGVKDPAWYAEMGSAHPGNYGPVLERVIDESKVTYFVSLTGDDANDGRSRKTAYRTMQKAADAIEPGQTVLVTKGVYKNGFHVRKEGRADAWLTFLAEPDVEIRGSDVRKDWKREEGEPAVWSIPRPELIGYFQQPHWDMVMRTEQVFVNGRILRQVPAKAMLKSNDAFYVDDEAKQLYASLAGDKDPNRELTEVSMRTWAISIGAPPNLNLVWQPQFSKELEANPAAYVRIDGFRIRNIANFSRHYPIAMRGRVHHIVIENCDVQWCNHLGIGCEQAVPGYIVMRHNNSSNNGVQGMGGGMTPHQLLEWNVLDNNNYKGMSPWGEGGGLKTGFWADDIVIRHNVARNNDNEGLWIDYSGERCIFEYNLVVNSLAAGILNEITPCPPSQSTEEHVDLSGEEVRKRVVQGTIIRYNVIAGVRPPSGDGLFVSGSTNTRVYNNVFVGATGSAIFVGGSPARPHMNGTHRNEVWSNICYDNFQHARVVRDEDDPKKRYFDNVMHDNLFVKAGADKPFEISGIGAGAAEFEEFNKGRKNVVLDDAVLFRDAEHLDFSLTEEGARLAGDIGFETNGMRLDWSDYYVIPNEKENKRLVREFTPIDLAAHFNRGFVDEHAGDGTGGWSDQGPNDMSRLPVGKQKLDGVPYALGTKEAGAILLDTPFVKPSGFPQSITIPVKGSYEEVYFLYTQAWAQDGEVARLLVEYADRTKVEIPLLNGRHIYDWWTDPTWQQHTAINDNDCYVAWQGPNGSVGRVAIYYMRWANPEPAKELRAVTVTNRFVKKKSAFFLLGITGANPKALGGSPRVFHMSFDGTVDAVDSSGDIIEAQGVNRAAFAAGRFVEGVKGHGFIPAKRVWFAYPKDFPTKGEGTISLWLKADPIMTPERLGKMRTTDYLRAMMPFDGKGPEDHWAPWVIYFEVKKETFDRLLLTYWTAGLGQQQDVTELVVADQWFNLLLTWGAHPERAGHTRQRMYMNGKLLGERDFDSVPSALGKLLYVGVPENGGQPWVGAMDELSVWNRQFDLAEIAKLMDDRGR